MRAACLVGSGRVSVGDFDRPRITGGEVLVRMTHASICGSDVHVVFDGFHLPESFGIPGFPGHEGVGVVVESRSERVPAGTAVLTIPVPSGTFHGCFAEFMALDAEHVIELPAGHDHADIFRPSSWAPRSMP